MPADDRFVTRAFRAGDETRILDLFARSFPHAPRTLEHFRWKYEHDPFGSGRISITVDETGRLLGHYAGYAVPFRCDGRDVVAHQIGDTMTEPSIRHIGRGSSSILGRTALHFYATFCEGQVGFNYGFNVANIQKFSLRFLRSDRVEPVAYRVAPPPAPIARYERWRRGYQLALVHAPGKEIDRFFERVAPAYGFLIRRDAAYLRWRYFDHPDVAYVMVEIRKWKRLAGWMVFRLRGDTFTIVDLLVDPRYDDVLEVLLRHVVAGFPVSRVEGWFPPRPAWLDAQLERAGFARTPEPQDLSVMCVPFTIADATERMRASLYYTMGDSDLV